MNRNPNNDNIELDVEIAKGLIPVIEDGIESLGSQIEEAKLEQAKLLAAINLLNGTKPT